MARKRSKTTASNDGKKSDTNPVSNKGQKSRIRITFPLVTITPIILGLLFWSKIIPNSIFMDAFERISDFDTPQEKIIETSESSKKVSITEIHAMENALGAPDLSQLLSQVSIIIHRNGEVDPCGTISPSLETSSALFREWAHIARYRNKINKYYLDSMLTATFANVLKRNECESKSRKKRKLFTQNWFGGVDHSTSQPVPSFFSFCDMGPEHTPVQLDHHKYMPVKYKVESSTEEILPCHFHTREGVRILDLEQLMNLTRDKLESQQTCPEATQNEDGSSTVCNTKDIKKELHLYAVPAGRVFIFAPSYVGEIFDLPHVKSNKDAPVSLEVLSVSPRIFDIHNFFNQEESKAIVDKALNEKSESHRIKRSSTGASGYNLNSKRTSENGFDTHGKIAMDVKKRCFQALGFDEYIESMADGLQVLRYNVTTAYVPHLDWIDDYQRRQEHNFDSAGVGSNRFATILLYMTDVAEDAGGETVFSKIWPASQEESEDVPIGKALENIRKQGIVSDFRKGSWEEKMVAECRTRFSVRPSAAKAVLFYSQHPDGEPDEDSLHGGCPVLSGNKWAANLWVWNAPRSGYPGAPVNEKVAKKNDAKPPGELQATFSNSGKDPFFKNADLYFQETYWSPLGADDPPSSVNTFEGHQWNVYVDGKPVKQWVISKSPQHQEFQL